MPRKKSDNNLAAQMAADSKSTKAGGQLTPKRLKLLGNYAEDLRDFDSEILRLEKELKEVKKKRDKLKMETIPDFFDELGLSSISLLDGSKVEIIRKYAASITEKNKKFCFTWLRKRKHGSLIKHTVSVSPKKDEVKETKELLKFVKKLGVTYTDKEAVHPQTLQAFVREQKEAGTKDFPDKEFGVFPIRITNITN